MTAREFPFPVGDMRGHAVALGAKHIVLNLPIIRVGMVPFIMPVADAKALSVAIEAAVTCAENVLPGGLGESTVAA